MRNENGRKFNKRSYFKNADEACGSDHGVIVSGNFVQHLFLRAYITADQLSQLKLGDKVKVFSDLGKDDRREYEGTITWISDKSEFTPKTIQTRDERANLVYATKIAVKNDGYIKIGMYGEMKK